MRLIPLVTAVTLLVGCARSEPPPIKLVGDSKAETSLVGRISWTLPCFSDCSPSFSIGARAVLSHENLNGLQDLSYPERF